MTSGAWKPRARFPPKPVPPCTPRVPLLLEAGLGSDPPGQVIDGPCPAPGGESPLDLPAAPLTRDRVRHGHRVNLLGRFPGIFALLPPNANTPGGDRALAATRGPREPTRDAVLAPRPALACGPASVTRPRTHEAASLDTSPFRCGTSLLSLPFSAPRAPGHTNGCGRNAKRPEERARSVKSQQ